MNKTAPHPVRLADYRPPNWLVESVDLTFRLDPRATRVRARIGFRPNPAATDRAFRLDGERLELIRTMIDGHPIDPRIDADGLTAAVPDRPFLWDCEVEIVPEDNTELEGLYMSKGMFCTQCEAQGFRKITFYPDRPDVMAPFSVRVESDLPVLLSNGNPVASGPGWAEWHDPWPKPSYLFALVAGDLVATKGRHRTGDGRDVALNIWVRPGDEDRTGYVLDSLKRAMEWDERVYGRAYDLDVFNLVAVDDFNAGAMENKGLNIFNAKYVLASPETATDHDYELIEGIVAHEYFHNWTGNRITCRDWFQLCLKEGLTVFRDQQFSGDMRGHAIRRIDDVITLRARQFREDNGPLAHPVRPEEYFEINNFYTATVYEKGAELIGMLKRLVGDEAYARALDLYFARHDGQAATIEDWLRVFEDATGRDLSRFKRWYSQAGTPRITVLDSFENGVYTLDLEQKTPPTPGTPEPLPQVIPVAVGLLGPNGDEVVPTTLLELTEARQSFRFEGLGARPVPSILRGFSAPVVLERVTPAAERLLLLAHDTDPFNRWEAGRQLAKEQILAMLTRGGAPDPAFLDAWGRVAEDGALDPAFRAFALGLPSEDDLAQTLADDGRTPDPLAIHAARETMHEAVAARLRPVFARIYDAMADHGPYAPDAAQAGRRALRLAALGFLTRSDGPGRAQALFKSADNMTESLGALARLIARGAAEPETAAFHDRWQNDPTILDKWFAVQIAHAAPEAAVATARALTEHPLFAWKTPNRFRAVVGALAGNAAGFHDPNGGGYDFVAGWLIRLDPVNPQTAARMATVFETWRRYDGDRQGQMRDALTRIRAAPGLSPDMSEITARILGAGGA